MCINLHYCVECRYITTLGAEQESSAPLGEGTVASGLSLPVAVFPTSLGMLCVTSATLHRPTSMCTDTRAQLQQVKSRTKQANTNEKTPS